MLHYVAILFNDHYVFAKLFSVLFCTFLQVVGATPTSFPTAGLALAMLCIMDHSIITGLLLVIS